jgi:hypothetical protein
VVFIASPVATRNFHRGECFPAVFEGLVNAVACQQLSLTVGIELLNRLQSNAALLFVLAARPDLLFPGPKTLCV